MRDRTLVEDGDMASKIAYGIKHANVTQYRTENGTVLVVQGICEN